MAVNLSKNGTALTAAYSEVVDGKSNTNWVLYTYEGNTNDVRVAGKGDGGLEEMVEELSSGKVMYAFCRVLDPNSGVPKYVLVNWTGEGVKDARKGMCANHVRTMANFLRGAHVTINARSEDDAEPEVIMEKVAKASGINFNFHKESNRFSDAGPQGPVGSVYQKTSAVDEIKGINKDNFWAKAEQEEKNRRQEERRRVTVERQRLEQDRKEQEAREAGQRERLQKERASQIDQQKRFEKKQEVDNKEQERQQWEQKERQRQTPQRKNPESVQKANEAASIISQRSTNPREMFKQKEKSLIANNGGSPAVSRPGRLQSPFFSPQPVSEPEPSSEPINSENLPPAAPVSPVPASASPGAASASPIVASASPVPASASPVPATAFPVPASASPIAASASPVPAPASPQQTTEPLPEEQLVYDVVEEFEDEWQDSDESESAGVAEEPEPQASGDAPEEFYETSSDPENLYEDVAQETQTPDDFTAPEEEAVRNDNLSARALYDYQGTDDTEITFDPNDIITGIEMIDEGWWRGYSPDGHYGMFPANYVELL